MTQSPAQPTPGATGHPTASRPIASLHGVAKGYMEGEQQRTILTDADLELPAGEWLALLGPSGAGKSTLIHLLAGIDAPDTGRVEVQGADLQTLSETARTKFRAAHVGLVFQFFHLLPTLTVLENVLLPLELAGRKARGEGRDRAMDLLERVGLADRAKAWPDVLSGGEQQRIAVARALVTDPSLVLADEPTGNLDAKSAEIVLQLMADIAHDPSHPRAVLMVTHSQAAAEHCDRIIHLHDGRLLSHAAAGELGPL